MLELMFCSMFTILPDYLYRRYRQGKRFGAEITFYSVWYELRYGITACVMLTITLITVVSTTIHRRPVSRPISAPCRSCRRRVVEWPRFSLSRTVMSRRARRFSSSTVPSRRRHWNSRSARLPRSTHHS
jgi:hypothetical protein